VMPITMTYERVAEELHTYTYKEDNRGNTPPKWMQAVLKKMKDASTHNNVRLFLGKLG